MSTVNLWRGEWGDAYHDRNKFTPEQVRPVFDRILSEYEPFERVLEVGCGLGHNLMAVDADERYGVEPNDAAREAAQDAYHSLLLYDGEAQRLPFRDDWFDLVFTCGLLIHIPPQDIRKVVEEVARVSRRFVLAVEYAFPVEEVREYRGEDAALWVRPYGTLLEAWGSLRIVGHDAADSNLYPGCEWWLCEKGER